MSNDNPKWTDIDPETGKTYNQLWQEGWEAGYNKPASEDLPKEFVHRGDMFARGYAEGLISASSKNSQSKH